MGNARSLVCLALSLVACKREAEPAEHAPAPAPREAAAPKIGVGPTWYRAALRSPDGVEVWFFLGVPAPGTKGQAVFKVGDHEVRNDATFDGKAVAIPMPVHQTAVDATVGADGAVQGQFTASWRAWGAATIPLTGSKVPAPTASLLATVGGDGAALDLGEPRTTWKLAIKEAGAAKLVLRQTGPGDFQGALFLDSGNIIYVAGNGRGDAIVMTGFDGTSGYRIELAVAADRKRATGKLIGGHRLDWRDALTATRGADFELALKPRPERAGVKIGLPELPELAAFAGKPLVVEIAGSWCSTCKYAAPFLVDLYRELSPRGLNMVTLLYELTGDRAADAKQAEAFKAGYGVGWTVVPVPGVVDDFYDIMPAGLSDLNPSGFPIMLFLAPDRSLRALHAGFPAEDTGEDFTRATAELRANAETLLAK